MFEPLNMVLFFFFFFFLPLTHISFFNMVIPFWFKYFDHQAMTLGIETTDMLSVKKTWIKPTNIKWLKLEGGIPSWMSFSSYSAVVSGVSDNVNIPLLYSCVLIGTQLILLTCTAKKWISENHKKKIHEAFEGDNSKRWSKFLFSAFDHSTHGEMNTKDQKSFISETLGVMFVEDNSSALSRGRTRCQWCLLYFRQFLIGIIYLALQLGGWYAILYLTVDGDVFKEQIGNGIGVPSQDLFVDPAAIAVSVINAVNNLVCSKLVKACKFDDNGSEVKVLVALLFVSRTFNILIQLGAYVQMVAPFLFLRTKLETNGGVSVYKVVSYFGLKGLVIRKTAKNYDSNVFSCRSNQFGNQFFSLLVTEFVMGKILGVAIPSLKWLISKLRRKKFVKSAFDIPSKLVALLFFQQLSLISMPLLPVSSVFSLMFLTVNFKWDVWVLVLTQTKPKKPWAAKDAGGFYLKLYAVSVILVAVAVHSLLKIQTLPKLCPMQSLTLPTTKEGEVVFDVGNIDVGSQTFRPTKDCDVNQVTNMSNYGNTNNSSQQLVIKNVSTAVLCSCSHACGPWINSVNGYAPILEFISHEVVSTTLYTALNSIQLWMGLAAILIVSRANLLNTISVDHSLATEKDVATRQASDLKLKEIRSLRKKLTLQQQANR